MGYAKAQYSLGLMYKKGHGVEQNYDKANEYFALAAEQGVVHANIFDIIFDTIVEITQKIINWIVSIFE